MKRVLIITIVFLVMIADIAYAYDPFAMLPGARARSMGGAFTAVSDDSSSIYYNPAGLVSFEGDGGTAVSMEVGEGLKFDIDDGKVNDDYFNKTDMQYFLSFNSRSSWYGIGVAFYNLYNLVYPMELEYTEKYLDSTVNEYKDRTKKETIYVSQDMKVIHIGFAAIALERVSLGATAGLIVSNFKSRDNSYILDDFASGYLGTFGTKVRLIEGRIVDLDIGANYRMKARMRGNLNFYYTGNILLDPAQYAEAQEINFEEGRFWDLPGEVTGGAALRLNLPYIYLILTGDFKETYYDEDYHESNSIRERKAWSYGGELTISRFRLSAGLYNSRDKDRFYNTDGYTAGVGFDFDRSETTGNIGLTFDHRDFNTGSVHEEEDFYYASVKWQF